MRKIYRNNEQRVGSYKEIFNKKGFQYLRVCTEILILNSISSEKNPLLAF